MPKGGLVTAIFFLEFAVDSTFSEKARWRNAVVLGDATTASFRIDGSG